MVGDNVDHNPNAHVVGFVDESLEVVSGTEVRVDAVPVASPVSVISTVDVVDGGRYPDGIEAHTLDIVQVVDHSLVVTTAVIAEVPARVGVTVATAKSIGKDLVDGALLPGSGVASVGSSENS